jgi:large subunit ribosomal protein L22
MATPENRNGSTEVRAQAKWVRVSPRKARLVVDHIRGRTVPEARTVLAFTPRAAAREIEKVLRSAVANAENNHGLVGDELVVSAAFVDEGPTLKRWRARARGRAARIRKRTCHITLKLGEDAKLDSRRRRPAAVPGKAEEPRSEEKAKERRPEAAAETSDAPPGEDKPKRAPRRRKTEEVGT